jgi:hypothetical protein
MSRLLTVVLLSGLAAASSGCAMCCAPFDYDYPQVAGGRWVRNNPSSGRVGSAYGDAGGPADAVPIATTVVEPTTIPAAPPAAYTPAPRAAIPRNLGETYLPGP